MSGSPLIDFRWPKPDMRLTESLMAAFDAANDSTYRPLRERIAKPLWI